MPHLTTTLSLAVELEWDWHVEILEPTSMPAQAQASTRLTALMIRTFHHRHHRDGHTEGSSFIDQENASSERTNQVTRNMSLSIESRYGASKGGKQAGVKGLESLRQGV